jgi:hypothetical protein
MNLTLSRPVTAGANNPKVAVAQWLNKARILDPGFSGLHN